MTWPNDNIFRAEEETMRQNNGNRLRREKLRDTLNRMFSGGIISETQISKDIARYATRLFGLSLHSESQPQPNHLAFGHILLICVYHGC